MKIAQFGPYPLSSSCIEGGVEASVYGLSQELMRKEDLYVCDIPRINLDIEGLPKEHQVYRYKNIGSHQIDSIKVMPQVYATIANVSPDICHMHGSGITSFKLSKNLDQNKIPYILTIHGLLHVEKKNALKKKFSIKRFLQFINQSYYEFRLISKSDTVIVDTEYVKEQLELYKKKSFVSRLPEIHVIPQGINSKFYSIDCSKESKVILSVGTIARRKGHLILLQAFDELCKMDDASTLNIVGVIKEQDYYNELTSYIEKSPNKDRIRLETNLDIKDLFERYKSAHLFVLHSQEESQGIVFAEAMAAKLPVVSTNVGGIPNVVENGKEGYLVNYGDVNAFAEKISLLMNDSALWKKMSANAFQKSQDYNWTNIADKIVKLYKNVIANYKR